MNAATTPSTARERLLVLIVAYHAESTLAEVLDRIPGEIVDDFDVETLIIDDASQDRTYEVGGAYAAAHPEMRLTVLRNRYNQGYGGNQKIGYEYAISRGFDFVALIHGDGQYAPEELPRLIRPLAQGEADVVLGSRMMEPGAARRGGMPRYKHIGNRILSRMQNVLLGEHLSEYHSGYRVYSVSTLKSIHYELNTNDFHFDTQIILQLMNTGARIVEMPIPTYYGSEICRVNGLRYAWNVSTSTLGNTLHRFGLLQQRRFDPVRSIESVYRPKLDFTSPHSLAIDAVPPGTAVIDLGAGPGDVANALTAKGCRVTVVDRELPDSDTDGIEVHVQDLNDELGFDTTAFDVVMMLDVIEHLADPEDFMRRLRRQFGYEPKTLILSTPNIAFISQRLGLMFGQFNYGKTGILDRTHTRLFTFRTIKHLLRDEGFTVKFLRGVPAPFPLVAGRRVGIPLIRINEFLIALSRSLFSFQIFIVAESTPSVPYLVNDAIDHSK